MGARKMRRAERWRSKYKGGSDEEPQKHHRTYRGDGRQQDEGVIIVLTTMPGAHDGLLDERYGISIRKSVGIPHSYSGWRPSRVNDTIMRRAERWHDTATDSIYEDRPGISTVG